MALVKCPHCGQPISDSAMQCPHCQNQFISKVQRNRIKKCSLIAMWLTIVATIQIIIRKVFEITNESLIEDNLILFGYLSDIALLCIVIAWLIWFTKTKSNRYTAIRMGTVICCCIVLLFGLYYIPEYDWWRFFGYNNLLLKNFFFTRTILFFVLFIAFGIVLFFLRAQGKISYLLKLVGAFYVAFHFVHLLIRMTQDLQITLQITDTLLFFVIDLFFYLGMYFTTIILFYSTYKQAKIEQKKTNLFYE